jgi:hypothetical protein
VLRHDAGMRRSAVILGMVVSLAAGAAPAAGAGWSRPATLLTEPCAGYCSPAPDIAINRAGTVVALYRQDKGLRNFVRLGDRRGRFGAPQALPRRSYPGKAAIADDGTAVIVWAQPGQVRATFRHPGGRFGRSVLIGRIAGGDNAAIDDVAVGLDASGRSGVVAWTDFHSRKLTMASVRAIDARAGRPAGDARQVDSADYMRLGDLAVNRSGQVALSWVASSAEESRIGVVTGGRAGFSEPATVSAAGEAVDDPQAAIDPSGAVAVAYTSVTRSGDAGARGVPVVRVRPAGASAFGPGLRVAATQPGRLFGPLVAFAGSGRAVLLYQEKTHIAGFSRAAPLREVAASADGTALGTPATVGRVEIARPRIASLQGGRVLGLWQIGERAPAPLAGALSDATGAFRATDPPPGRIDPFSDASGNRALAAAGRYAAFIWGGGGDHGFVRVSVRRF